MRKRVNAIITCWEGGGGVEKEPHQPPHREGSKVPSVSRGSQEKVGASLTSRQCVTDSIPSRVSLRRSRFLGALEGDWPLGHYSGQYHGWHEHHRRHSGIRWLSVNTVVTGGEPVEFISWCEGTSPALLSANLRGPYQEIWILGRLALFIIFSGSVKPVILYNIARLWLIIYSSMVPLFHFYLLSILFIHDAAA